MVKCLLPYRYLTSVTRCRLWHLNLVEKDYQRFGIFSIFYIKHSFPYDHENRQIWGCEFEPPQRNAGGGLEVIVLAFCSNDPSSNLAEVYRFLCKILLEKNEINKKRPGWPIFQNNKNCWWLDSNRGSLVLEVTTLPTVQQPLAHKLIKNIPKGSFTQRAFDVCGCSRSVCSAAQIEKFLILGIAPVCHSRTRQTHVVWMGLKKPFFSLKIKEGK